MSREMNELMQEGDEDFLAVYKRYPIVFDHGEGVYLYDVDGKRYLDFAAGIAVSSLGYGNAAYKDALKSQIDKVMHVSNLFYNEPAIHAAHALKQISGMDRVFFTNSGTEAVEGALKAAYKYAFRKNGNSDPEIIAMNHSFHGRTYGSLSVTGTAHYREGFGRMPGKVKFAEYNDLSSVEALVSDATAGIILETVQGEGGLTPADPAFLQGVREICNTKGIPLILDEIQCGMGRTGSMFAWQEYGVKPDIMTIGKAVGGGVPVAGFLMTEELAKGSLLPGDHGTTYGGNPFACSAILAVLKQYESLHLVQHVRDLTPYLEQELDGVAGRHSAVVTRRGKGFMQGLVLDRPVAPVISRAMEKGLIVISAGANILRIVPPLVITRENIDEMISILDAALDEAEQ